VVHSMDSWFHLHSETDAKLAPNHAVCLIAK
jgi:hypothetical protein